MAGRVKHIQVNSREVDRLAMRKRLGWRRRRIQLETERRGLSCRGLVQGKVRGMKVDGERMRLYQGSDSRDVIDMAVGEEDRLRLGLPTRERILEPLMLEPWIDDQRFGSTLNTQ